MSDEDPPTAWATLAEVETYAKVEVEQGDLDAAQATIDIRSARTVDDWRSIGQRDRYWLKLAVAYQAAWLSGQPDAFERIEVTSTGGQGGAGIGPEGLVLAPFARRALKRVSWLRSRSLHVRAADESSGDPDAEDRLTWREV